MSISDEELEMWTGPYEDGDITEIAEELLDARKKIRLLEQFYAERNQQLIDENRELRTTLVEVEESEKYLTDRVIDVIQQLNAKDELLWWLTAEANRVCLDRYGVGKHGDTVQFLVASVVRQMLATQGYTREELEKR